MFEFLRRSSPLWRHADFNRLWAAQILSAFGSRITRTAIPIIAVSVLLVTPWEAAVLSALSYAPYVLAGLFGGGFVERSNKTRLMVTMDLVRFALVIAAPAAWFFGWLNFPLLCLLAAGVGLASALFQNADVTILPRLVGKDHLVEANSRLQATESIAELTGPGAAGILVDLLTAPFAMVADALTFIWSAFWLWRIPKQQGKATEEATAEAAARPNVWAGLKADIVVGFSAVWRCRPLRAIISGSFFWYISGGFFFATLMVFLLRELHMAPSVVGIMISVGGFSALLGSLCARPLAKAIGYGPAIVAGFCFSVVGLLMLVPAALFKDWALLFLVLQQFLGDFGIMMFMILSVSLQQKLLPEEELARANGFNQVVSGLGMTISILIAGWVAETIGVSNTVMLGACIAVIGIIPLLTPHLLGIRDEPAGEEAPAPAAG
ncbi:MAG TPA: MFS transporter [Hyphomonadaceae bacterium]|nr:MFS transporter [Hyphomonadaceae bacterium]